MKIGDRYLNKRTGTVIYIEDITTTRTLMWCGYVDLEYVENWEDRYYVKCSNLTMNKSKLLPMEDFKRFIKYGKESGAIVRTSSVPIKPIKYVKPYKINLNHSF